MALLISDNDIDVILRAKAMVHSGEEAICVRWEVDANDIRRLVGHDVKEARILMREAIVVLRYMLIFVG